MKGEKMKTKRILAISVLVLMMGLPVGIAKADFTFGEPTNLGPTVNSSLWDFGPTISADGLSLYFDSIRFGGYGGYDMWLTFRATTKDPWGEPVNLGSIVNSPHGDRAPSISTDGISLFFVCDRPEGFGERDIWVTTRPTTKNLWGEPVNLGPTVNSAYDDYAPDISANGLTLYFVSNRHGGYGDTDIWVTTRITEDAEWNAPFHLGSSVNSSYAERQPTISADSCTLFFASGRPGGFGSRDIWMTTRSTPEGDWDPPVNLGASVNTPYLDHAPDISSDGRTLFFSSDRPGGSGDMDLWQTPIIPIVDLNNDGIVDSADMCIMVDHWGTDNSLCDIGPMPWGDSVVDVEDLKVLAENLFTYPGAVAYWNLDETEGDIAHDSIGDNDGTVNGEPAWQPDGGMVNGALQLDGIDDYISTEFVLSPVDGEFSIFTWVKGGAPGQVLVSQVLGVNWLMADSSSGNLMTELKASVRSTKPLLSEATITDSNWHQVGLVWDGTNRILYMDDVPVAADTQLELVGSNDGLNIGCGPDMTPSTYWSGLIDDVRIYNRAIIP
jgi:Tol biopolymer transport system component